MDKPLSAFTIRELVNNTDSDITITIISLGTPTEPFKTELSIQAHQTASCLLSFGRQEELNYIPPSGYLITHKDTTGPFRTICCVFDYVEDPLIDIPIVHGYRFRNVVQRYHWSLFCDEAQVASFSSFEHERIAYKLIIGNSCSIKMHVL